MRQEVRLLGQGTEEGSNGPQNGQRVRNKVNPRRKDSGQGIGEINKRTQHNAGNRRRTIRRA